MDHEQTDDAIVIVGATQIQMRIPLNFDVVLLFHVLLKINVQGLREGFVAPGDPGVTVERV